MAKSLPKCSNPKCELTALFRATEHTPSADLKHDLCGPCLNRLQARAVVIETQLLFPDLDVTITRNER